jgi:hypothetical protein
MGYSGKIVIVIEAVDELESTYSGSFLKYWLPECAFSNIRFIFSISSHS